MAGDHYDGGSEAMKRIRLRFMDLHWTLHVARERGILYMERRHR